MGGGQPERSAPADFEYMARAPFVNHVGPIFQAISNSPGSMCLGLWVDEVHCNTLGFMHGGMTATIVDSAMARALVSTLERRSVTLKMELEYFDTINRGDWLEAHGRLLSHDDEVGLTTCEVRVGGKMRARGSGVFRLLRKKG
jgi:acyl-coenzyme A thioesterase PaaI-like protein